MHVDIVDSSVAGSLAGQLDGPPLRRSVLNRLDAGLGHLIAIPAAILRGPPSLAGRRTRYGVFFATYLYQGLIAGFSLTALANHLAVQGRSAAEIGVDFALAGLPWTLQPVLW